MVNSIKWFFTTPDNLTVVPLRVAPGAHTFVLGEYATLRVDGAGSSGVSQGDRAKWVNDGDTCDDADAGYYVYETAQTSQTYCADGTYQPSTGQTS